MFKPSTIGAAWMLLLFAVACAPIGPLTVTLIADGETRTLTTDAQTVGELLNQANVTLDQDDRATPPETAFLRDGMTVRVVRVEVHTETEERTIPYSRETVRDTTVPVGETRLLRAGVNGTEQIVYAITLEDGVEVDRRVVQRMMLQEPRNEVILIGTHEEAAAIPISGTVAYLSAHNGWVMRATTSNRRRLTATGDLDGRVFSLSPDGSWLLFTRTTTDTTTLNTLWLVNTVAVDGEPTRLPAENVLWAAWAPDGERIAYSTGEVRDAAPGWEAANDLFLATPRARDGQLLGRRRILAPSAGGAYGWWGTTYAWAPDGEFLAYSRADEVGVVRLYDGEAAPLLHFPPYRTYGSWAWAPTVAWSPEGAFIATVVHGPAPTGELSEDSPVFHLYALGVALSGRGPISPTLTVELASEVGMWAAPSFSPDGSWIAFGRARIPYTSHTSSYDLCIIDRDGSDRRVLLPSSPQEPGLGYPATAWSPWGETLLAVYRGDLYHLPLDGQPRRITDDGAITTVQWQGQPDTEE